MKRKVIFVALILTLLMIIPTISAEDINGTQEAVLGNDDVGANASFSDLDLEIYSSSDTLNLEKDYIFNDSSDSKYTDEGIKLSKSITINGNGHYIDAKGSSRIFTISASNVVLNNITFKNANSTYGGAINWIGGGGDIINSEFINNTALDGGAVFALNSAINIENSTFVNGSAIYAGGSVYQMYGTLTISNSNFSNNAANDGGALCADSFNSFSLYSSQFISNIASRYGGAICILFNSNFNNQLSAFSNNNAGKGNNVYYVSASEMLNISPINTTLIQYDPTVVTSFPSYYNLADEGYVTPVKDQGNDGNCWAFSALAALESAILKATGKTFDFSENNMKNLAARFSDYGWSKDPNSGGNPLMAIGYLASWLGPVNESDDEYRDDGNVFSNLLDAIFHVQDVAYILRQSPEEKDAIKSAIMTYGAVATNLYWSSSYLRAGNYYCPYSFSTNHAITIVGWDDAYSRTNFRTQPAGDGAWIIKNSWGTGVGNGGYYYVSYYDKNFALSNNYVFILNDTVRYENIYQYESAKSGYYHGPATNTVVWGRNIYVCENDEFIAGISTYFDVASEYEINVDVNRSGVTVYSFSQNGSSFAGYHTIKLNNYILLKKDDVFTITIKYVGNGYLPLYRDEDMCKPYSRAGISYGSVNNMNWEDLIKFNSVACIKAFTVSKVNTTIRLNDICNVEVSNDFNLVATVCDQFGNLVNVGQVLFKINNASYVVNVTNGVANLNLSLNTTGLYNISCIFTASNYYSSNSSSQLNVYKHKADLTITVDDVFFGEEVTVKVNITNGATGNVTIVIDENHMKNVSIINNVASFTFSNFNVNNYTVHVYYAGDLNFNESLASSTFKVKKIPTSIDILQIDNLTYGNDVVIPFNITDGATGNVNVTIYKNDELIKAQLFNVRSAIVFSMLDAGNYAVTINYGGDEIHAKSQSNSSFRISKARSSISINPISDISYGDVLVVDLSWVNCSGGYYELNFNGSIIRQGNLNESLSFFDLTSGDYSLFVFNEGDGNHNSSDAIAYFSVHKVNSSVLIDVIRDIVYGNDLVVSFVVSDGCVGDVNVSVLSDGLVVGCRVVGVDGDCVFSDLDVGEYVVNVTYLGDVNHFISSNCSSFNISKSSSSVEIVPFDNIFYGEVLIVDLSLVNGSGGYYELIFNGSVIRQGGLNDSLIFSDLNAGDYSLFVLNEGDANHNSSSGDVNFTVFKANSNVMINNVQDIVYGTDLVVSFVVSNGTGNVNASIVKNNHIIDYQIVDVNDNEIIFHDLEFGEYNVNISYLGDNNHFKSSNNHSFNVFKASSNIEISKIDDIDYGNELCVKSRWVNGSAVYQLIFDSNILEYGNLTNHMVFNRLNAGNYTIIAINNGDLNHNPSNFSVNFTINKIKPELWINVSDIVYGEDILVLFNMTNGITGNVYVSVLKNNSLIANSIVNTTVNNVKFFNIDCDTYLAKISYGGDINYLSNENASTFTITRASSDIRLLAQNSVVYPNPITIESILTNGSVAHYQLFYDGSVISEGDLNSSLVLTNLKSGNYTLNAINYGDLNHNGSNQIISFAVNKSVPNISIVPIDDVIWGSDAIIPFSISDIGSGNIEVNLAPMNITRLIDAYQRSIIFENLSLGCYDVSFKYYGDENHTEYYKDVNFNVKSAISNISLELNDKYCNCYELMLDGEIIQSNNFNNTVIFANLKEGIYTINLFDNSEFRNCINVTLSQNDYENLTIVYDNKEYVKRVADGLKLNILDFTKNIDVNVIINSIYTNTTENDSEVIKIDNVKLTLTINDLATNKENIIPVNLPSDANGYVTLEINNSTWTFDVINGSTNIVLPNLSNGMYDCVITYWGDEKYSDISTNESIVVKLNADDLVGLSQGQYITDSLSINFPNDAEGKATLIINGRTIVGDIVNSQVVFDMRGFDDGYYPYSIVYSGDSNYASFSRQGYLTIKNMKDTVILADSVTTAYLSTVYLIATLRDSNNNALNDANIVVMIDGQIFNLITDNNGQVKLPINLVPGSHICKISFNGNNVYKSSSKTVDIIVLKSNIKLKVLKKTFKRSVKVKKFKITLKNTKNNAIKRYKVSLKVKGKKYVVKTNKKGLAIFKLTKLTKKGIFVAKIMVKGNKYYNSITKKVKIKIK